MSELLAIARLICVVAALAVGVPHTAAAVQQLGIGAGPSCGTWLEARQQGGAESLVYENWAMGYISGIALGTNRDALRGTDYYGVVQWIDRYCSEHPTTKLDDAIIIFFQIRTQRPRR